MAIYTVHVPRAAEGVVELADRTAFVRDGFNGWAFLFGPLYLLRHRAWVSAAVWLLVVLGAIAAADALHLPGGTRLLLLLLLQLFLGLEGTSLRRAALRRRGFDLADVVAGTREEGELTFFRGAGERAPQTVPAAQDAAATAPVRRPGSPMGGEPVIGLFPGGDG